MARSLSTGHGSPPNAADCPRGGDTPPGGNLGVSVLIPVLNEEGHLRATAEDMLAQRYDGQIEFLFIEGGSQDRTAEILDELARADSRVRILHNRARRTPQALNLGLSQAQGEIVARMDAHTHYPPDYIALGVRRLRGGDVVSVSGPQLAVGTNRSSDLVALALRTPIGVGGARFRRATSTETEVISGFTGLWRRDVLLSYGGWDEGWLNDQDTELAARLRADGGRIVCLPEMAASYIPREGLQALGSQYWKYGWYRVKTSRRHPETLRRSQLLPPALVLTTAAAVLAPERLANLARAALATYACTVLAISASVCRGRCGRDVAALSGVYAVMHAAYGGGFLTACAQLGLPRRALVASVGVRRKDGQC